MDLPADKLNLKISYLTEPPVFEKRMHLISSLTVSGLVIFLLKYFTDNILPLQFIV